MADRPAAAGGRVMYPKETRRALAARFDREALQAALVKPYRPKRDTVRPGWEHVAAKQAAAGIDNSALYEDPSPEWVWMLVAAILRRTGGLPDRGETLVGVALGWCKAGSDPAARSEELQELIRAWHGPRVPMLRLFFSIVMREPIETFTGWLRPGVRQEALAAAMNAAE